MAREVPTGVDLERFLIAAGMLGLTPSVREQYLDLDAAADAAYETFQDAVKIKPFLAETNPTTKYYDAPGGPYVPIHPYVSITAVYTKDAFATNSTAQSQNQDWEIDDDAPYRRIIFNGFIEGPRRVGVTGRRGWMDDLPARVFNGLLAYAAGVIIQPSVAAAINAGAVSWQEGDVSEKHGSAGAYSAQAEVWRMEFQELIKPYPKGYKQVEVWSAGRIR